MAILVAGATGVLGRSISQRLLHGGGRVRVMTRDPRRAASLDRACAGISHVITTANAFAGRGADNVSSVDRQGNRQLIDAARRAGVGSSSSRRRS